MTERSIEYAHVVNHLDMDSTHVLHVGGVNPTLISVYYAHACSSGHRQPDVGGDCGGRLADLG